MKFKINNITQSMTKEEKILEYARRISFYHSMMTSERKLSKIFKCTEMERNAINGELVGCLKRPDLKPCESCENASRHYVNYRNYNKKRATALRQLNVTLYPENSRYDESKDILKLMEYEEDEY